MRSMSQSTENSTLTQEQLFNEELLPHADALYNFAYHLTYNQTEAEDLVQETFLKAYRFIKGYEKGTNAKAWLFKILKNIFINDYRKKTKQPNRVDYEEFKVHDESEDARYVGTVDMRQEVYQNMLNDEVSGAVNQLPVDFKTIILLCDVEGFTYEEIAKIIDIPIGTVRSRLFRARNMLKSQLKKYAIKRGYKDNRS